MVPIQRLVQEAVLVLGDNSTFVFSGYLGIVWLVNKSFINYLIKIIKCLSRKMGVVLNTIGCVVMSTE